MSKKIEIKKENKIVCAKSDALFKNVVGCEKGKHILKAILEELLNIKIDDITIINTELEKMSTKEKGKFVDCVVTCKGTLFNVEINRRDTESIKNRNLRFIMTKHINQFRKGEDYYKVHKSIQINLDWGAKYDDIKKVYMFREENNSEDILSEDIVVYKINMDKVGKLCYTCDRDNFEYKYLGMLALEDKEKLLEYCKGDEIMEDYAKDTIELNNNDIYKDIFTREEDEELIRKSELLYARDEGEEIGNKKKQLEIARNMLEKDTDIKFISEVTGLSIEEIENLK